MLRSLTSSAVLQTALSWVLAKYMQVCAASKRWERRGTEHRDVCTQTGDGFIAAFWHSRITLSFMGWDRKAPQTPTMLISRSKEGDFIARFARNLSIATVRGSSRNTRKTKQKGGLTAFRDMVRAIENRACMGLTVDGPRGPRQRASMGVIQLARTTSKPIMIFSLSVSNKKVFNSWDRFILPFPFGKGVVIWKEPLYVPPDADDDMMEALRLELEMRLNDATREADEAVGGPLIEPAEPRLSRKAETGR
ncbi:lysophospholipid acyltransferase family protein [Hyphobacterium sp. HN65]|uniref:Lysophospholipid acyltransferase family protein n=1 Tax=Hyphobacterium lacteum TaxID=3116575 RepID=A0ABU7LN50_9PROT|nr:lysophospholipid acyltransferase family protein [Hyphobacterium sp. HN65]MEE2525348.1 lysophospholipid acyltransferase family protein [Hyphobacterium sp. HN65]